MRCYFALMVRNPKILPYLWFINAKFLYCYLTLLNFDCSIIVLQKRKPSRVVLKLWDIPRSFELVLIYALWCLWTVVWVMQKCQYRLSAITLLVLAQKNLNGRALVCTIINRRWPALPTTVYHIYCTTKGWAVTSITVCTVNLLTSTLHNLLLKTNCVIYTMLTTNTSFALSLAPPTRDSVS